LPAAAIAGILRFVPAGHGAKDATAKGMRLGASSFK
jgi:hypothetical protein